MASVNTSLSLLLTALVVLSMVPAASAGPTANHAQQADPTTDSTDDGFDPADEIYVRDNGSAVLVYNSTTTSEFDDGPSSDVEYGADVSSDLFYFLVTEPIEGETNVTGQGSLALMQSNLTGDGQLSIDQPEALSNLSFQMSGETTAQNSESSLRLDATIDGQEFAASSLLASASTSGNVTATGSDYAANGQFDAQFEQALSSGEPMSQSFVLTEDDGDYTVDVERDTTLSSFTAEEWSTEEQARATIEEQFGTTASEFDGDAEITIESYEYSEGSENESPRLDIAYTVEYTGIEEELTGMLAQNITESEEVDIDEERAEELTTQMQNLTVERIAANYEMNGESATGSFEADIRNYDDAVLAGLEIAEQADPETLEESGIQNVEDLRAQIEAQQAADLQQRTTWNATVTKPSAQEVAVTAEVDATSENWGAYVTELEDRGVETYPTSYEASATTTDDGRVNMTGSLTVDGDVFTEVSDQMMASQSEGSQPYVTALLEADPQGARMNVSADGEEVRIEAGAQFENLSALRDALAENETIPEGVTSVVGRTTNETTTTYVTIQNAVGPDATESDVRALEYVGEDTTVYMPGDWDREFPSMDTERAASFVDVESTATGGSGPGFGVTAALAGLVGAALLARRRA